MQFFIFWTSVKKSKACKKVQWYSRRCFLRGISQALPVFPFLFSAMSQKKYAICEYYAIDCFSCVAWPEKIHIKSSELLHAFTFQFHQKVSRPWRQKIIIKCSHISKWFHSCHNTEHGYWIPEMEDVQNWFNCESIVYLFDVMKPLGFTQTYWSTTQINSYQKLVTLWKLQILRLPAVHLHKIWTTNLT